jgi:hypothetical protein
MNDRLNPFVQSVVEDTQHWLLAAVVGLNLCPFAKAVVVKNLVRYCVAETQSLDEVLQVLRDELLLLRDADPERLDTTLLVLPKVLADFYEFNQFLTECEQVLVDLELEGVLQIADFHPHYQFAGTDADDISNYTNRAPYPTLHLLREASIDKAVASFPDAADIFERNMALLNELGHEGWAALGVRGQPRG